MLSATLPLTATRISLAHAEVQTELLGSLDEALLDRLRNGRNTVVLGAFGSGKTTLCSRISTHRHPDIPPCTTVPLRIVARAKDWRTGLVRAIGEHRLKEAHSGQRVLLLDGLDEIPPAQISSYEDFFEVVTALAGPTWIVTSRPAYFRTELLAGADQIDTLSQPNIDTLVINPLSPRFVHDLITNLSGGSQLINSVAGLAEIATSPILLKAAHSALPSIEPGRPIQPWGVFDAWVRRELHDVPEPDAVMAQLTELAWHNFSRSNYCMEETGIIPSALQSAHLPKSLRRSLFVTDLDGLMRFGHRSIYEFFLASAIAPRIEANQDEKPDALSGVSITQAMRAFTVGRLPRRTPITHDGKVLVSCGNFIAGGDNSFDERPLRIQHLARPVWLARAPVTHRSWSRYIRDESDHRIDANYLPHWGPDYRMPHELSEVPVFGVWPEDADRFASRCGARLPTADEWEKGVRGIDGRYWPWGDYWQPRSAITAEHGLSNPISALALGVQGDSCLFGAIGNVFEYTSTPWKNRTNRGRVVMGGAFNHPHTTSRASLRLSHKISGNLAVGLRLAWDA